MITIAFHTPNLNFRGSCVALRDYAMGCETFFGFRSIIVTDQTQRGDNIAFRWFSDRFPLFFYQTLEELHIILIEQQCNLLYTIKYGTRDSVWFDDIPTIVHCVFDMSEPHGHIYAGVSQSLAQKFGSSVFVPHMVSMPRGDSRNNLRLVLGIPADAIVFGRHGGIDTFNLTFAMEVISQVVRQYSHIYFLFLNAPQWDDHPQIIRLKATTDVIEKQRFICTCDAMIVPETMGHTFGMSIAEFSIHNKPILCYNGPVWNTSHIDILGNKGIYFDSPEVLFDLITTFTPLEYQHQDWNAFREFTPEKVMNQFKQVFLDPLLSQ